MMMILSLLLLQPWLVSSTPSTTRNTLPGMSPLSSSSTSPPRLLRDGKHDGDEDHVVDVEISFYNDSTCAKPIAEKGEPIIAHIEIDSSEEQAQCREIPGGGFGSHYQYWCHPSGNEISGKLLCNPDCR